MIPLGQFRDTFIIAIDDEGVAIVDQHVAHERVLFEQITERLTAGRLESQRLLTPILLELSSAQRGALEQHRATLERFGMEIEEFGGDSVRLSGVPAVLEPAECEATIRALAEDLDGLRGTTGAEEALRRIAATMACHAAVKANYPLTLDKMRYILEELRPDEELYSNIGGFGSTGDPSLEVVPYSWLHMNDNVMDPFHVHVLHSTFTGPQFASGFLVMPTVDFFYADHGVCYSAHRRMEDGREMRRVSTWLMPNIMSVPTIDLLEGGGNMISWVVPVSDSSHRQAMAMKLPRGLGPLSGIRLNGKLWGEMTEEDHQRTPGDYEAQRGQGPISLHSEEHLVTSDRGIIMQRRMLQKQCEIVAGGGNPAGVEFSADEALVKIKSGNFYTR